MARLATLASLPIAALLTLVLLVAPKASQSAGACNLTLGEQRTEELSAEPVANARIIVGVALQRELPAGAAVIAVATAQQESRLRNLTYGDRDSLGLFPAETVRGMGEQRPDPRPGVRVDEDRPSPRTGPGWHAKPLTVTAQVVQRSAFPKRLRQVGIVCSAHRCGPDRGRRGPANLPDRRSRSQRADRRPDAKNTTRDTRGHASLRRHQRRRLLPRRLPHRPHP